MFSVFYIPYTNFSCAVHRSTDIYKFVCYLFEVKIITLRYTHTHTHSSFTLTLTY